MADDLSFKTPKECWRNYQDRLFAYWARLQEAGANENLKSPAPALRFDARANTGTCTLGGDAAIKHLPMATSQEVDALFQAAGRDGLVIGGPGRACALAFESLRIVPHSGRFVLQTTSYKYSLLYKSEGALNWAEGASALRFESESASGFNSWILNHPIHHVQPGDSKSVRIRLVDRFGVVGFVDWILRSFGESIWANLYQNLYLSLTCRGEPLYETFGADANESREVINDVADSLQAVLAAARSEQALWYKDLGLWNQDTGPRSEHAPELHECFLRAR